jgi:pimeloyl-ACP methyl ester carboxylesterase
MLTRRKALLLGGSVATMMLAPPAEAVTAAVDVDNPQNFSHRFLTANGLRLHYVEEGRGPLVVLLHGYPFLWYVWRHQIKALAAAGYRVVALDQRGYGQSDTPEEAGSYDITNLVGDVVGLINALGGGPAALVGHDWGSQVVYNTALMRPDLVRGAILICAPPSLRGAIRPSEAARQLFDSRGITFYRSYLSTPEASTEIMKDLRRYLLGFYYSTSGYAPADEQMRWAWKSSDSFSGIYTVPDTLPPHLSVQALNYYVGEFARTGIRPANNWYAAIDKGWENTSFLDGATARPPALFITGDRDPSARALYGIDRQQKALDALKTTFQDMRDIVMMKGVGHTPPEERPAQINAMLIRFLNGI